MTTKKGAASIRRRATVEVKVSQMILKEAHGVMSNANPGLALQKNVIRYIEATTSGINLQEGLRFGMRRKREVMENFPGCLEREQEKVEREREREKERAHTQHCSQPHYNTSAPLTNYQESELK
ncbi:hypothetical protein GOP47_0020314, partial [Adiantum capillus-veneris]